MPYKQSTNLPEYVPFLTIRKKDHKYWGTMAVAIHLDIWKKLYMDGHSVLDNQIQYVVGPLIHPGYFPVPRFYTFDALYFIYKQTLEIDKILDTTTNPGGVDILTQNPKSYMVGEIQIDCISPCELSRGASILLNTITSSSTPHPGEFV